MFVYLYMLETIKALNEINLTNKKSYSVKRNALYKELSGSKEVSDSKLAQIEEVLRKEHDEVNEVMANLREFKHLTYNEFDYLNTHVSKSKQDFLKTISFLNKAHEALIELFAEIQSLNRVELNYLQEGNFKKALATAVKEKEMLYEIIGLGENIGHDYEEGISYNTGWYSEVLANQEKLLRPLHFEYESHKEHSNKNYKSEAYKDLLKHLDESLGYKHNQVLDENAKLLIAEKLYESVLYFIHLSKALSRLTNQCTACFQELKDVKHKGFRGYLAEFFG